jgi:hypothetical protein
MSLEVVDEWRDRVENSGTLDGSSNGGMLLSSRAALSSAAHSSFSASQEAARSKLWSLMVRRRLQAREPDVSDLH